MIKKDKINKIKLLLENSIQRIHRAFQYAIKTISSNFIVFTSIFIVISGLLAFINLNEKMAILKDTIQKNFDSSENSDDQELKSEQEINQEIYSDEEQNILEDTNITNNHTTNNVEKNHIINCDDYTKLLTTVFTLQKKLDQGDSFQKELVFLSLFTKDDQSLTNIVNKLEVFSESGVPNLISLKEEFASIENDLIMASWIENQENNIITKIKRVLSKFIFIKRVGQRAINAGGIEMIIQNVNNDLDNNDIELAKQHILEVQGQHTKPIISIWLEHVNSYIEAHNLSNELYDYIIKYRNCSFKSSTNKSK